MARDLDEDVALRRVLEGTAEEIGRRFFGALVESLAGALGMHAAMVTEYLPERGRARTLGVVAGGQRLADYEYDVGGTPCGVVLRGAQYVHCAADAQTAFPTDADLQKLGVVSYMGVPLHDPGGGVLGHLAVMDTAPMTEEPRHLALFHLFARRAASELQRLRADAATVSDAGRDVERLAAELRSHEAYARGEIVGRSAALDAVLRDLAQVAPTDATVLVLGETGTGKELIARAVHEQSARRQKPFVTVNCAAIAPALIESELFGHEQGAFTGATRTRDGRFALADGGTIFLDEIGELPLELQPKLLRVLQQGELERVGGSTCRTVDVRVVAATNRDLEGAVARGEFRADLFHRLHVFPLRLPPLRERGDDVVLLANAFAAALAKRLGRRLRPLDAADAARLRAHTWPGNVRELQNVIERAVIRAVDGRLDLGRELPGQGEAASRAGAAAATDARPSPPASGTSAAAADERIRTVHELVALERANILRALDAAEWRVSGERGAARLLEVHPSTLSSRMKALGIRRPRS